MQKLIFPFFCSFFLLSCGGAESSDDSNDSNLAVDTLALVDSVPEFNFDGCPKAWNLEEAMAAPDSFCALALLGHQMDEPLTKIPDELAQMPYLRSLDLSVNRITQIPDFLSDLEEISLYGNLMTECPKGLENLKSIKSLDLSNNRISEVDSKIFEMNQLEELYLSDNQIETLPDELFELTNLKRFGFSGNPLIEIPSKITQLVNLEQLYLSEMDVDESTLPPNMGDLKNLKTLYIGAVYANAFQGQGNGFTEIPDWIFTLDSLETLDLSYGRIESISPKIENLKNLSSLNLEGNALTELPEEIRYLPNLKDLLLGNNNFSDEEIERIKSWFDEDFYLEFEDMNAGC